jgi:hypothetical protein
MVGGETGGGGVGTILVGTKGGRHKVREADGELKQSYVTEY